MYPGESITIAGQQLTLPRITLGGLAELGDRMKLIGSGLTPDAVNALVDALWFSLKRNYPDIARIDVENSVDLDSFRTLLTAFGSVNGFVTKKGDSSEAQTEGNAAAV